MARDNVERRTKKKPRAVYRAVDAKLLAGRFISVGYTLVTREAETSRVYIIPFTHRVGARYPLYDLLSSFRSLKTLSICSSAAVTIVTPADERINDVFCDWKDEFQ